MENRYIYADLHMHTPNSDGTVTLDELPRIATENNLGAVAVTDHDRIHPELTEPLTTINGVDVINGLELRVTYNNSRIDLLAYGVEPTSDLRTILDTIRKNRINRAEKIIDLIEDETDVRLDMDISDNTGRPHIARAIDANSELPHSYNEAFSDLIGNDCPAYASREIPSFEQAVPKLKESSHFVSLAHPFRYDDPINVLKSAKNLDGVECIYPYDSMPKYDIAIDELAVNWFDLIKTGGSDAHDIDSIGSSGVMREDYITFLNKSGLINYSTLS